MLPAEHRLTDAGSYRDVIRTGRLAAARTMVLHLAAPDPLGEATVGPRVGFVVSKAVGGAVTRNRVQRRLRHLVRQQLQLLPDSCALVIRALPTAGAASSAELDADLGRCLRRVTS